MPHEVNRDLRHTPGINSRHRVMRERLAGLKVRMHGLKGERMRSLTHLVGAATLAPATLAARLTDGDSGQ
jgi:hypothetical protein